MYLFISNQKNSHLVISIFILVMAMDWGQEIMGIKL